MDTHKLEQLQMGAAATIGMCGITIPNLEAMADIFTGLTVIVSFFFIVIPTGVWACVRAIKATMDLRRRHDKS